ncbi:YciI family protein [Amycolatopsis taiwanensis]|uniref:YCII-related domain-containing protein n=1 Tax=Amycolatopsis taiwanensis TaxID=342230 RepID=A0A9W6R1C4_9PSEU|nr:YciI family protein [Amycolatopsis taiwanensis]GLY67349.1 hypothetical protein Atai01_39680 [Amycolatopsis taiwanensis]
MAWFVVEIRYVPDKFQAVRPAHREFLARLAEAGTLALAGPVGQDEGGIMIVQAEHEEALRKIVDNDPYHVEGVIAERTIREFKPVLGAWLP